MATNDVNAGTGMQKEEDDFFDDPPKASLVLTPEPPKENGVAETEPPKENGDAETESPKENGVAEAEPPKENGDAETEPPKENGDAETEPPKENGDVEPETPKENGEVETPKENGDVTSDDKTNGEGDAQVEGEPHANGDDAITTTTNDNDDNTATPQDADTQSATEADAGGSAEAHGAAHAVDGAGGVGDAKEEPTADEGFQSTSPTPQLGVDGICEEIPAPGPVNQEETEQTAVEETTEQEPEQTEREATPLPDVSKPDDGQEEGDLTPAPTSDTKPEEGEATPDSKAELGERTTPSGGEDDYEDSFVDDASNRNEATPSVAMETPIQGGGSPTDPHERPAVSPSPSDSRAEASSVLAVASVGAEEDAKTNDDRSSMTEVAVEEQGELYRGEDRKEEPALEESENCRGQGQWKSEEHQYLASAILVQKSEKEALDEAVKEKEKLFEDYSEAKTRMNHMEEEIMKRDDKIAVDKELMSKRDKEIAELRQQLEQLKSSSFSEEDVEFRVKDLQERLAVLARENEQKDKRIVKLEEDLIEMREKLRETERKLLACEASNLQGKESPKSKTCVIM